MRVGHFAVFLVASCLPWQAAAEKPGTLELVGEATLRFMLWPVYESRLYSPDGDYSADTRPLRLEIAYRRAFTSTALVEGTAREWRHLGFAHPRMAQWLEDLRGMWPNVHEGDTLVIQVDGQEQSTFFYNGESLGTIEHPGFGSAFLAIWLSPDTSRPAHRAALLEGR